MKPQWERNLMDATAFAAEMINLNGKTNTVVIDREYANSLKIPRAIVMKRITVDDTKIVVKIKDQ